MPGQHHCRARKWYSQGAGEASTPARLRRLPRRKHHQEVFENCNSVSRTDRLAARARVAGVIRTKRSLRYSSRVGPAGRSRRAVCASISMQRSLTSCSGTETFEGEGAECRTAPCCFGDLVTRAILRSCNYKSNYCSIRTISDPTAQEPELNMRMTVARVFALCTRFRVTRDSVCSDAESLSDCLGSGVPCCRGNQ
jgi:hypothetical protein